MKVVMETGEGVYLEIEPSDLMDSTEWLRVMEQTPEHKELYIRAWPEFYSDSPTEKE